MEAGRTSPTESPDPVESEAGRVVERPSPLTGVARSAIAFGAAAVFLVRDYLDEGRIGTSMLFVGLALLAVAVIAGISGVLTWRTTTFVADDTEFRIERRLVSTSSTRIDYTKVQSVDLAQPLVARLLGLAKVHIDVGGAGGQDLIYLTKPRAEALREHLLARMHRATGAAAQLPPTDGDTIAELPPGAPARAVPGQGHEEADELIVAVPPRNLLLGTFVSLNTIGAAVGAAGLVGVAWLTHSPVTLLAAAAGVAGWVWAQTGRNWGFRMTRRDGALRLSRGALSTTSQGVRPRRIQGVAIRQDLLQRLTGLYQVSVTVLGYGNPAEDDSSATNAVVLPYGTWDEVLRVLRALWPEVDLAEVRQHGQPERARWLTPLSYATHTWGIGEHVVVAQHGLLTQVRTIVPHRRMQSASLSQGPLQRRLRLAGVWIHTTDGPVSLRLYHLDAGEARAVLEEQVARARRARALAD